MALFAILIVLGIIFVVDGLLALGVQYVSESLFNKPLPFWPVFVAIVVISVLLNRGRSLQK